MCVKTDRCSQRDRACKVEARPPIIRAAKRCSFKELNVANRNVLPCLASACLIFAVLPAFARAASPIEYNRDVRPILADHCFACHGADSASREADLRLDVRDAAIDAAAISPGKINDSELIARILSDDPDTVMPPPSAKKPLTDAQKITLSDWVAAGAEYQAHWSFIAPTPKELPPVTNAAWANNEVDHFILTRLEANGLSPAREAAPHTLFRRVHLDITGLPPAENDVATFTADYQQRGDAALSDWIDKLMESSAWGEHRARYWLDAARYGDTHGLHFDNYREMWPYRDWVIRAFNSNQPFDQFTIEQLAGDLLPDPTLDQRIATGFQRCNITTNEGGTIDAENLANYAVDRVQTFGWVYLGLTTNCCQCHDHKFDPLTMKDFYSLSAYFRNTTQGAKDGNAKDGRGPVVTVPLDRDRNRWNSIDAEIAAAKAAREARRKSAQEPFNTWLSSLTADAFDTETPTNGRLASLPLTEGSGNQVSASPESEGVKVVATGDLQWVKDGKIGPAIQLKSGRTLELGSLGDFALDQPFSHAEWIRTSNPKQYASVVARMDERNKHRGWDLFTGNGTLAMHIVQSWPENALKVTTQQAVLKKNVWQHVCVTWDGSGKPSGISIYVDGVKQKTRVEKNTLKPGADVRTDSPLRIGQRSQAAVFEGGSVQDFQLFNRVLTDSEIQSLGNARLLAQALATDTSQRTAMQTELLLDHFLERHDSEYPKLAVKVDRLNTERAAIESRSAITHVQVERSGQPAMANILMRGAYDAVGEQVAAAPPAALHPIASDAPRNRLGLARWTVDPANPLTARVTVNRFWQEVFGQGIVATPEDFGVMGAAPTHPELLDWLAVEFRNSGWDVKKLFKLILMSATYRQAAVVTTVKLEKDRDNLLLSRGPRFRMDAEMVRDYALAASGLLSSKMFGPGTKPYQPSGVWDVVGLPGGDTRNYVQDKGENLYRRTVYHFIKRMAPPPSLDAFNAPSREVCTVRRERTNTPLQALVTLNDPQFVEAARTLAQHSMTAGGGDVSKTIDAIAKRVLGRSMSGAEKTIIQTSYLELHSYYQSKPDDAKALIEIGESKADSNTDQTQLAAWTMVCNEIMNLDEVLNK